METSRKVGFFEEENGARSMKRLSAFILLLLFCFDVVWCLLKNQPTDKAILLIISGNILILLGLATLPIIMEAYAAIKSSIIPTIPPPPAPEEKPIDNAEPKNQ